MATLDQITYNIASQLEKENTEYAFIQRVKFTVMYYRSLLLRRLHAKGSKIPKQCYQAMLIPMSKVDQIKGIDIGYKLSRSLVTYPQTVPFEGYSGFRYIGKIDGISPFRKLNSAYHASQVIFERFTSKDPAYYTEDGYVYLINTSPKEILIDAVLDNPLDAENYYRPDGSVFDSSKEGYPISGDLIQQITQSLLKGEFHIQVPENDKEIKINE